MVTAKVRVSPEYRKDIMKAKYDKLKSPYHKCAAAWDEDSVGLYPRPCSNTIRRKLRMDRLPIGSQFKGRPKKAIKKTRGKKRPRGAATPGGKTVALYQQLRKKSASKSPSKSPPKAFPGFGAARRGTRIRKPVNRM